ncbi:hypothetical protein A2U01_0044722, partial [Trifolium medium]|nr:hypothetical protein [Trifolium medium]
MKAVKMVMESVERCKVKRLTLTPHYDPRVEEFVVNEVLSMFKQAEEEEAKAEEEEKRKQEEEKRQQEEKQKMLTENVTSDNMMVNSSEDKGKAVASEHDPLVLILQEQLATQKAEQELLKEEAKNLTESQHHVIQKQEETNTKLDAIL